jgi:hypothetical protein
MSNVDRYATLTLLVVFLIGLLCLWWLDAHLMLVVVLLILWDMLRTHSHRQS